MCHSVTQPLPPGSSSGVCSRWRATDEEAEGGERDGAEDGQTGSLHLLRLPVDQRAGNYNTTEKRSSCIIRNSCKQL